MDELNLTLDFSSILSDITFKSFIAYFLSLFFSVIFAGLISFIYELSFAEESKGIQVNKSFIILAPAVTTIFLVIQFSLPLSLGLLGALSFVRFRTPIKEPEEIGFILVVISTSLSCAVYKFDIALLLILSTFACVFLRNLNYYKYFFSKFLANSNFEILISHPINKRVDIVKKIKNTLKNDISNIKVLSISEIEGLKTYHIKLSTKKTNKLGKIEISSKISSIKEIKNFNVLNS